MKNHLLGVKKYTFSWFYQRFLKATKNLTIFPDFGLHVFPFPRIPTR